MTTTDTAYAAYTAGQQDIKTAWMAIPENATSVGQPSPPRYQLDRALEEHYRTSCPTSPDYVEATEDTDPAQIIRERDEALAEVSDLIGQVAAGITREYFLHEEINRLRTDLAHAETRLNAAPHLQGAAA